MSFLQRISIVGSLGLLVFAVEATAQVSTCDDVQPDTKNAVLEAVVTTVTEGFRYDYAIVNPASSTGCLYGANLDVSTKVTVAESDVVVGLSITRHPNLPPFFVVPGTYSVTQLPLCRGGLGGVGGFGWSCVDDVLDPDDPDFTVATLVTPGQRLPVFSIVSSLPPGLRPYELFTEWDPDAPGTPFIVPEQTHVNGVTIGPTDPSELAIYNGGGQKPDDVNLFLRFTNPLQRATNLRSSETNFPVSILYGSTSLPGTFKATLNRTDITAKFSPAPGKHEAVNLTLRPGRNTVVFTIRGKNARGGESSDTDRLVLIVSE